MSSRDADEPEPITAESLQAAGISIATEDLSPEEEHEIGILEDYDEDEAAALFKQDRDAFFAAEDAAEQLSQPSLEKEKK